VLLLSVLGIIGAHASSVTLAAQLLLPVLWVGAIWAVAGWRSARRFLLPFGFLYFAVPVWDLLNTPLQDLTVVVVSAWIRFVDIPAYIEGNLIHIPSGTFEVAGGCSGLHYFVVGLALAAFCGILHHDRWGPRCGLVVAALGLALCANWVRVFTVIVAGHLTEMKHFLVVTDHYYFGWVLFLVFFVPVFLLDRRLQSDSGQPLAQAVPATTSAWPGARILVLSLAIIAVGASSWMQRGLTAGEETATRVVEVLLPDVPGWSRLEEWRGESRPSFVGVSGEAAQEYAKGSAQVGVYVGHYAEQRQGHEAIFYANRAEGEVGDVVAERHVSVVGPSGAALPFAELEVVDANASRRLVWRGIRIAGWNAASNASAKALQVAGVFAGRRHAQVLVLAATCPGTCERARDLLSEYAAAAAEAIYESAERSGSMD
jgi:EpsI family protein